MKDPQTSEVDQPEVTPAKESDNDCETLFNADPECDHEIETLWSGIKCKKCAGWFCY
jgi:hypothetical protein